MTQRLVSALAFGFLAMILNVPVADAGHPAIVLTVPQPGETLSAPVLLTIDDIKGSYTIPHIQSSHEIRVQTEFAGNGVPSAQVCLVLEGEVVERRTVTPDRRRVRFMGLPFGEYSVRVASPGAAGIPAGSLTVGPVGVGTIIAALGDSITEGYHGHGFFREPLDLRADLFPPEAVSRDGRNFPQFSPTTWHHKPSVNCFQSWMTDLNNLLAESWQCPVFIANEGWGGLTSGAYLKMMREDAGWRARMKQLQPQVWLIHLGVNDERHQVPPGEYAANMEQIVITLMQEYGARKDCIFIARPSYDYAQGAEPVLRAYISEIDLLIAKHAVQRGPDFFAAYATERERLYGTDPVHPNAAGMELMARLWADAILALHPQGVWWHDR
ncbi:MAG: hypothetical protein HPY44_17675 [Armatimonadetes bacterium]|nr:hypothetical protein [Armatimonadota bacterium]